MFYIFFLNRHEESCQRPTWHALPKSNIRIFKYLQIDMLQHLYSAVMQYLWRNRRRFGSAGGPEKTEKEQCMSYDLRNIFYFNFSSFPGKIMVFGNKNLSPCTNHMRVKDIWSEFTVAKPHRNLGSEHRNKHEEFYITSGVPFPNYKSIW